MKSGVIGRLFLASILLVLLSFGIFAAAPSPGTCSVVPRADCVINATSTNYILMGLSAATNAHGQSFPNVDYPYVLCCAFGTGNLNCNLDGTNKILGLSSLTNAHVEAPSQNNYQTTKVCYEDLQCIGSTSDCGKNGTSAETYKTNITSISALTNAHVGAINDFPIKICCKSAKFLSSCTLKSAVWNLASAIGGQTVRLEVTGSGSECDNQAVSFQVLGGHSAVQKNPLTVNFQGDKAYGVWKAEWQAGGDPQFYYNATLIRSIPSRSILSSNPKLTVKETNLVDLCSSITTCSDYSIQGECESDATLCNVSKDSSFEGVDCNSPGTYCGCAWNAGTCGFTFVQVTDSGNATTGCSYGYTLCNNATAGNYCNLGNCPSGQTPISDNDTKCETGEGCTSSDCKDGDQDTCSSNTYCSLGKCSSVQSPIVLTNISGCKITQTIEKACDVEPTGYKILKWTGVWTGTETSGAAHDKCIAGGRSTVPCPAQVQLPFFDYYDVAVTIIVIALVYLSLIFKRRFRKKKKN